MRKTFSLDEAQTLLPVLGALLKRAREAALRASEHDAEMQALSQRIFHSGGLQVDVPAAARMRAERDKAVAGARATIEEIEAIGAIVADLAAARLEFPCAYEGREILLRWTMGEEDVAANGVIREWREDEADSPVQRIGEGMFRRDRERPN